MYSLPPSRLAIRWKGSQEIITPMCIVLSSNTKQKKPITRKGKVYSKSITGVNYTNSLGCCSYTSPLPRSQLTAKDLADSRSNILHSHSSSTTSTLFFFILFSQDCDHLIQSSHSSPFTPLKDTRSRYNILNFVTDYWAHKERIHHISTTPHCGNTFK